jgi:hypothetical protein
MTSDTSAPVQALTTTQEEPRMKRYIAIVQDRSGSMVATKSDAEGGLKSFLAEQAKEPGTTLVTLNEFDNVMDTVYGLTPIAEVEPYVLHPRGGTALRDALGYSVEDLKARIKNTAVESRPDAVIVLCVTDGEENASRAFDSAKLTALLTKVQRPLVPKKSLALPEDERPDPRTYIHQRGWLIIYLGSNQDAIVSAKSMGVSVRSSMSYAPEATCDSYTLASASVSRYSSGGDAEFTSAERKVASGLDPDTTP